jgi:RNA recognition motif-containing protein
VAAEGAVGPDDSVDDAQAEVGSGGSGSQAEMTSEQVMRTLHVKNVGSLEEEDLNALFSPFGEFVSATIRRKHKDGVNASWALVTMGTSEAAAAAQRGRVTGSGATGPLVVNWWSPRQARASTGAVQDMAGDHASTIAFSVRPTSGHSGGFSSRTGVYLEDSPKKKGSGYLDKWASLRSKKLVRTASKDPYNEAKATPSEASNTIASAVFRKLDAASKMSTGGFVCRHMHSLWIHPYSRWKRLWDCWVLLLVLISAWRVPYQAAFTDADEPPYWDG